MDMYVAHGVETEEEENTIAMNTPPFTNRPTGKDKYCNVNRNNEILISIVFQHINMIVFHCCS